MITFLFIFSLECVPEWRKAKDIIPQAPGKPPQEPKLAKYGASDSYPFRCKAIDQYPNPYNVASYQMNEKNWKTLPNGVHCLIDGHGNIIAGPKPLLSQSASNLNSGKKNDKLAKGKKHKLEVKGFGSVKDLIVHFIDVNSIHYHGDQYPDYTAEDYEARAVELAESVPTKGGIRGFDLPGGNWVRYDPRTNDFVKANVNGIVTMFKPSDGSQYYEWQRSKMGRK